MRVWLLYQHLNRIVKIRHLCQLNFLFTSMQKESTPNINPLLRATARKKLPSAEIMVKEILKGNRVALSQAITLIESTKPEHQQIGQEIITGCLPKSNQSIRIGVTGTPGVGKSTFIEAFGMHVLDNHRRLAVLAIDPSSQISKGSILGDKTRMPKLTVHPRAYIRPSPAGDSLGGVARKTRETIIMCEAAGFDTIIIETVGVGQSETAVHSMTDFFLLLLLPGAGDELQGIKRGIVEMADLLAVNKADGDREMLARQAKVYYQNALHLFPVKDSGWIPQVLTCSALSGMGVSDIWSLILDFERHTKANGTFALNRGTQSLYWMQESIRQAVLNQFYANPSVQSQIADLEVQVLSGKSSPFQVAEKLLGLFHSDSNI